MALLDDFAYLLRTLFAGDRHVMSQTQVILPLFLTFLFLHFAGDRHWMRRELLLGIEATTKSGILFQCPHGLELLHAIL